MRALPEVSTALLTLLILGHTIASAAALDCYACHSNEDAACGTLRLGANQTALPSVQCAAGVTACFTRLDNEYVERGCEAELERCTGDECSTCSTDLCNGAQYPVNGLQCVQCSGEECQQAAGQQAHPCPLYRERDTCYSAFSKDGQTIYRGCFAADQFRTGGRMCSALGSLCVRCSRDGCNTAQPIIQDNPLACVKCNSLSDPDCTAGLSASNRAAQQCDLIANGQTDECYVQVRNGTVQRGCLSENFQLELTDCAQVSGNWCERCSGPDCNRQPLVAESCVECDSETDGRCVRAEEEEQLRAECPLSANKMGCYRFQNGGDDGVKGEIVKRGCLSRLDRSEARYCELGWSECKRCHGDNCNAKPHLQTCYNCTTSENLSCYINATNVQQIECDAYTDECFVHVVANTVTRGCLAEATPQLVADCSDPAKCERCDAAEGCNAQPVGADDYCYTCDSREDPNCREAVDDTMKEQCAFSVRSLGCYRAEDADGHVRRGCLNGLSNATEVANCQAQSDTCKTCSGPFCNAKPSFQRCRVCNSTDRAACIRSPTAFASQLCPDYLDECYSHAEGDVIIRGCLSAATVEIRAECNAESDELCTKCSAGGASCNTQVVDGEFCYECDSTTGVNCASGANFTMRKQCPLAVGQRGCYLYDDGAGLVKRGCVADLIAEERQFCRREEDTCKTCAGNDCNSKQQFSQCRTCNSTQSVNCIRAAHVQPIVTCRSYSDECYTHVSNTSIVTRGCVQQHTAAGSEERAECDDIAIEKCETCTGPGTCNQRLIDGEFCMRCDTDTDPDCRANLNASLRAQCPLSPIRRGCYRREDASGRVQRGCLADLPEAEIDECKDDVAECKSCMGDDCNDKPEFQRCRTCNSTTSVNCIRAPNSFASVVCRRYLDECYTHVHNDVVIRGCLAAGPLIEKVDCYTDRTDLCAKCSDGPSCNNRIVDGEFCLTCDSETDPNCASNLNYTMRTQCPLSVNQKGCYLFDDGAGLVKRGCVADLIDDERAMCREEGDTCKTCLGNDCNQKRSFQSCRTCNSTQSVNCIRAPHIFPTEQCQSYDDQCVTHVRNNTVTRGCLGSAQLNSTLVQTDCASDDGDHCEKCDSANQCNQKVVDGEFCLQCDSATDPNCRDNLNHTMRVQCPLSPSPMGCYRAVGDDGHVSRGCVADLAPPEVTECRKEGDGCKTCRGDDCNAKVDFQRCRACSSANSVNCIRSPGAFASITCRSYTDECYVHVADNIVTRGCLADLNTTPAIQEECSADGDQDMCQKCGDRTNCNNRLVDGEFCLACDSRVDSNCGGIVEPLNYTMREQCPLSVLPRGCYLADDERGNVTRGCVAKLPEPERLKCREEGAECKTCHGNDCNAKTAFQYCRTCSSEQSVSCIRSPGAFASRQCRGYLDECYTHVEGNVVTRGCLAEATLPEVVTNCAGEASNDTNEFCSKCEGQRGCNNRLVDGEFCLQCDSATDPDCADKADFTMRTQCPLAVRQRGCYRHQYAGGNVTRGCVADLDQDPAESALCRAQGDECKTCLGDDCNQQAEFQQCKQCSSLNDVDCVRGTKWVDSVTCRNYHDQCYYHVHNNTVTRGCLSDTADQLVHSDCNATNSEFCGLCRGKECNSAIVDGEFCLVCDSEKDAKCAAQPDWTMRQQCDLSVQRRGCYRYDDGGGIVKRGCVSRIHPDETAMCRRQGQYCKTCVGDDCNVKTEFQRCRVCNSTQSAACIRSPGAFASQICREYDDVCYSHVVDDVVVRGCLAAAPAAVKETCETNPELCEKCEGPSCNNRLVDGEFCMECDSRVDPNCRENLNHTLRVQCPLSVSPRGCYRSEAADGSVQRGCVAKLSAPEVDQCHSDPSKCKTCVGNDCNAKINFQQCKVCNSTENVDCIRHTVGWVDTVLCEQYTDECFVHVKDDVIVRGCLAEHKALEAECENPDLCEKCSGGGGADEACNAKIVDGEFCLTCDSKTDANCRLLMAVSMRTQCKLAVSPLGCFHFANQSNTNVQRGCLSDLSADAKSACRSDSECATCLGNDCNRRPEHPRCYTCDSTLDPHCTAPDSALTRTLQCADYQDDCFTHINGTQVLRGCLQSVPDIRTACERDERNCRICSGGQCNQQNVEPESCFECDSTLPGQNCRVLDEQSTAKRCSNETGYSFDRRGCYHQVSANGAGNEIVARGCVSHLERPESDHCAEQGDCKTCQGDGCNSRREFQSCFKCGFFDDANCADNTTAAMLAGVCNLYDNSCSTYILNNGNTVRGCTRDLRGMNEAQRLDCGGQNCNGLVYPEQRLRCHQCDGADCSDSQPAEAAAICRAYRADDRCYAFVDANNHMHRGCASDVDERRAACTAAGRTCSFCGEGSDGSDGSADGCNWQASFRDPSIECVHCGEADDCAWAQMSSDATACRRPVRYDQPETCYVIRTAEGVQRGCTNDLPAASVGNGTVCPVGASCTFCEGSACNTANTVEQACQVCNSSVGGQAQCDSADLIGFGEECPPSTFENRGCFTRNDDGVITRGCTVTLSDDKLTECRHPDGANKCALCTSPDCNTKAPPSAALTVRSMSVLTLVLTAVLAICMQHLH